MCVIVVVCARVWLRDCLCVRDDCVVGLLVGWLVVCVFVCLFVCVCLCVCG